MNDQKSTDGRTADEQSDTTDFRGAMNAARSIAAYRFNTLDSGAEYIAPGSQAEFDDLTNTLAEFMSPRNYLLPEYINSVELDDEDGAAPRRDRTARTFLFEGAFEDQSDDDELAFEVLGTWENSWNDERLTVETPAPWDVPDSFDGADPNDTLKRLPWGDDETADGDDREGAHYTFDDDDTEAPAYAADAWTLDAEYADDLRDLAESEGYEWVENDADDEPDDDLDTFEDMLAFLADGDTVHVRYEKKNGNGQSAYEGTVSTHSKIYNGKNSGYIASTGETWGLVFEDTDGKTKRVKSDDQNLAGLYSNSRYPYMGQVVSVTVEPASPDW